MNRRKARKPGVLRIDTDWAYFDNDKEKEEVISIVREMISKPDYDTQLFHHFEHNDTKYVLETWYFAPDIVYIKLDDSDEWGEGFNDEDDEIEDDTDYDFYDRLDEMFMQAVEELHAEGKL